MSVLVILLIVGAILVPVGIEALIQKYRKEQDAIRRAILKKAAKDGDPYVEPWMYEDD